MKTKPKNFRSFFVRVGAGFFAFWLLSMGAFTRVMALQSKSNEIEKFTDNENLLSIEAAIYCEKNSHKAIIIGKGGEALKRVGSYARADMEKFFGKKVYLRLWVKVRSDWRNTESDLKTLGFKN